MTPDECRAVIEECLDNGTLTKWESSFITSISDQLERGHDLSDRQVDILEGIHQKIFGSSRGWRE